MLFIFPASLQGCAVIAPGIRVSGKGVEVELLHESESADSDLLRPVLREITPEFLSGYNRKRNSFRDLKKNSRCSLSRDYEYRIGRGDVLGVIVWNHPELSNPMGVAHRGEGIGRIVLDDGTIFFPFAGEIPVENLNVRDVRRMIRDKLEPYIEDPQVDVTVLEYRSQKIYVTGEVQSPGVFYLDDRPVTILDAISLSGGFLESSDRRYAVLTRDGAQKMVDLQLLYSTGSTDKLLKNGDVIHVPEDAYYNRVFVMGEVTSQTMLPMHRGRMSLAEAISASDGIKLGTANTRRIAVIRGEPVFDDDTGDIMGFRPVIYQLDGSHVSALVLAEAFDLEPRDIVFIPATGIVRWNRVIQQILPTIQTIWMTERMIRS